ncbi:unnamed protein product, partial [Ectocarpus sp. 4 AP-2014]
RAAGAHRGCPRGRARGGEGREGRDQARRQLHHHQEPGLDAAQEQAQPKPPIEEEGSVPQSHYPPQGTGSGHSHRRGRCLRGRIHRHQVQCHAQSKAQGLESYVEVQVRVATCFGFVSTASRSGAGKQRGILLLFPPTTMRRVPFGARGPHSRGRYPVHLG